LYPGTFELWTPDRTFRRQTGNGKRSLSKDGKRRSFPKVPNSLQYVSNGNYYGRMKIGGKTIRESRETSVWTTATVRLANFAKTHNPGRHHIDAPLFKDALELFKNGSSNDAIMPGGQTAPEPQMAWDAEPEALPGSNHPPNQRCSATTWDN